jgi:drug/metabolite transporter (DMT)-like permease
VDVTKLLGGALIGVVVFAEIPDLVTLLSGTLIVAAVGHVAQRERVGRRTAVGRDVPSGRRVGDGA